MQVGDLIQCDGLDGAVDTGLICKVERVALDRDPVVIEVRYWAVWDDGQYSWVDEEDEPEIISGGG